MKQMGPELPGTKQVLLTFSQQRSVDGVIARHVASVYRPFLPKGLIIWGATSATLIHGIRVGNTSQAEIGGLAPIPARYFEQGRSFADLQQLAEVGEIELSLEARQQLTMEELTPGTQLAVSISGPYDRLVVWGLTYSEGRHAYRRVTVSRLDSDGSYSGRIDEVRLSGIETTLDVTGPDPQTVASLLAALQPHR